MERASELTRLLHRYGSRHGKEALLRRSSDARNGSKGRMYVFEFGKSLINFKPHTVFEQTCGQK